MKTKSIISWNVNGIRAVEKKNFLQWLNEASPDVLCIQETKANPAQLSKNLLEPQFEKTSYHTFWQSAKKAGYSGTAIFSKEKPLAVEALGEDAFDSEGRITIAHFEKFAVISAYFPNSQEEGARLPYKLDFCKAMIKLTKRLQKNGEHFILLGDYNIAHKAIDLANPKANENHPGYFPEERAWMDEFTNEGNVDTFRHFCKEPNQYTWWSYRFHAREKNIGWRIDYACCDEPFLERVASSTILSDVYGSDHCPIKIEVKI